MLNTSKALLIGVNYTSMPECALNGCINDIVNMRNMLIDAYKYTPSNITILRDDVTTPSLLPTRNNIITNLKQIVASSSQCREIWIHYSGHGSRVIDTNYDEKTGLDDVIVPIDYKTAGFILDDEIFQIIKDIKCRAFLMFDSCHSATVCDLEWSFEYKSGNSFLRTQNNRATIANPQIYVFSGCKDHQTSADVYNVKKQMYVGAMTESFIECSRTNAYKGSITNLYADICKYVSFMGYTQKPMFSSSSKNPAYVLTTNILSSSAISNGVTSTVNNSPASTAGKPSPTKNLMMPMQQSYKRTIKNKNAMRMTMI